MDEESFQQPSSYGESSSAPQKTMDPADVAAMADVMNEFIDLRKLLQQKKKFLKRVEEKVKYNSAMHCKMNKDMKEDPIVSLNYKPNWR